MAMLKYLARQLCNIGAVHKFKRELDKQTRFSDDYYISLTLSQYIQCIGTLLKNIFSSNKISDFKCQSHIPIGPSPSHADVVYCRWSTPALSLRRSGGPRDWDQSTK